MRSIITTGSGRSAPQDQEEVPRTHVRKLGYKPIMSVLSSVREGKKFELTGGEPDARRSLEGRKTFTP